MQSTIVREKAWSVPARNPRTALKQHLEELADVGLGDSEGDASQFHPALLDWHAAGIQGRRCSSGQASDAGIQGCHSTDASWEWRHHACNGTQVPLVSTAVDRVPLMRQVGPNAQGIKVWLSKWITEQLWPDHPHRSPFMVAIGFGSPRAHCCGQSQVTIILTLSTC